MSRPVSSLSTNSDYSGLFGLEAIRFEDASDFVEHCDQCFSPEEFVQRKAELHAILDATKEASLAQSGLQQQALIKTYYEREALKEFKDASDREDRPNSPMQEAYDRQFYCRGFPPIMCEPRDIGPHPDQRFHERMLGRMLWESSPCNICIQQMGELSELQARIEHVKALGKRSHEATIQQNRISNEIDDHIHNALALVTPVRDNAENFSAKISEDVENVRVALRRALVTPSSEPNGSEA
uniref:ING domain-containing protein n=1 Tax=Haemonchus contortus TaxID=6289 RepID=A0A7I4YE33_HAECO